MITCYFIQPYNKAFEGEIYNYIFESNDPIWEIVTLSLLKSQHGYLLIQTCTLLVSQNENVVKPL